MIAHHMIITAVMFWSTAAVLLKPVSIAAEPSRSRSDAEALNQIFGEQQWRQAAMDVHRRAMQMDPAERLSYLKAWVLPSALHADVRMVVDYLTLESVTASGDQIVSPSLDLIATAAQQHTLPALRDAIEVIAADHPGGQVDRLAMSALVSIEQNDLTAAGETMERMFERLAEDPPLLYRSRDAVLLTLYRASQSDQLSRQFLDAGQQLVNTHQSLSDRDVWQRHLFAIVAEMHQRVQREQDESASGVERRDTNQDIAQWHPVSRSRAWEHGSGFPAPRWTFGPGTVRNRSSHGDDFLFFASPLLGAFSVEGEATQFEWRETQFLTGGEWIAPHSSGKLFQLGTLRGVHGQVRLEPPMSTTFSVDSIHLRTALDETTTRTYFDGRLVHTASLPKQRDPWVAIRSSYRFDGGVDDLRIAGTPTIPTQISLSEPVNLPCWFEYFQLPQQDELVGWHQQYSQDDSSGPAVAEIIGRHDPRLPRGSDAESLLVYARPMIEDGAIEYEFWYQPDSIVVHPALGRQCFLLHPDGVRLHRLTDGVYERTTLPPGNAIVAASPQPDGDTLPLLVNQWNRARLQIRGDELSIYLNGQLVLQTQLQNRSVTPRTFALFHYADREQARVRRIQWSGDWPRQLPAIEQQLLASIEPRLRQEQSQNLKDEFFAHLDSNAFDSKRFVVTEGNLISHFHPTSLGMEVARDAEIGYRNAKLSPNVAIGGDFDVTVSFDQLDLQAPPDHTSTVMLEVKTSSEKQDLGSLQRKKDLPGNQIIQCLHLQTIGGEPRYHFFNHQPMLADAGQMRLSRRGDQLFYLIAEHDSDQFRIAGQVEFTTADIPATGIRFGVQIQGETGHARVRYKTCHIRAERIDEVDFEDLDAKLVTLDQQRQQLRVPLEFDFAKGPPLPRDFMTWNHTLQWQAADQGIPIVAVGTDDWTSAGFALRRMIAGDLDLEVALDPDQLALPPPGQECSVIFQLELADEGRTQISAMVVRSSEGTMVAEAQRRTSGADGQFIYDQLGAVGLPHYGWLRIARRGPRAYCIAADHDRKSVKIIAQADIGSAPLNPTGTRVLVHSGGAGRTSQVLVKALRGRVQDVIDDATIAPVRVERVPNPKPNKSLLQSILDAF